MKYRKPEVSVVGDAAHVIQVLQMKGCGCVEFDVFTGMQDFCPAYDLDE